MRWWKSTDINCSFASALACTVSHHVGFVYTAVSGHLASRALGVVTQAGVPEACEEPAVLGRNALHRQHAPLEFLRIGRGRAVPRLKTT